MIGNHAIKSYSKQQKVIALSSAEAELYAMVAASAETLAVMAYAKDLGHTLCCSGICGPISGNPKDVGKQIQAKG